MTTALFIGRFQPLHNSHLAVIKKISKEVDKLIIVMGSSQKSNTKTNPFSIEERKRMVESALKEEKISNVKICPLKDINKDDLWVKHTESNLPKFDVVYSGPGLNLELFKKSNYNVKVIKKIDNISSTDIRKRIADNKEWAGFVPKPVVDEIKKIKGVERIKKLMN